MSTDTKPRFAVVGTSHWHHKFYRDTIAEATELVGYSDPSPKKLDEVRGLYGDRSHVDWRDLLVQAEALDAVLVLGPHDEMAQVSVSFIEHGVPVILEKPGGMDASEVGRIRQASERTGVPTTVAFIQRAGNLWKYMGRIGELDYATFTFHSGPPERYINQSPWALERVHAGGGAFINLAVHYIDLFLLATRAQAVTVAAQAQDLLSGPYDVEDRMTALITTDTGKQAVVEVGYAFPASPDVRYLAYSARGDDGFLAIDRNGDIAITRTGEPADVVNDNVDSGPLTGIFMRSAVDGARTGFPGLATVADLHRTMQVVDAAYESAREERVVETAITW
jgi:predicted dehydrogenase